MKSLRARVGLVVVAGLLAASLPARGQVEPPPSPPVFVAPVAPVAEPPTTSTGPREPPTTTTTTGPWEPPSTTTTTGPWEPPSTTTTTSTTPTAPAAAAPATASAEPAYEPYSPPQMTWGVPAAPSPRGSPDPSGASGAFRGIEWGLGALATEGGGMGEGTILADLGKLALGVMATAGSTNEHVGFGLHLAGGPRFRLAEGIRLDGLVDLGLVLFGGDHKDSGFFGSSETSGSDQVLPAVGARLGVTFTSATSGWYLSLGPAIRRVPRTTVEYTTTDCFFLGACSTTRRTATYGGTIAGGFLTFGQASRRR